MTQREPEQLEVTQGNSLPWTVAIAFGLSMCVLACAAILGLLCGLAAGVTVWAFNLVAG